MIHSQVLVLNRSFMPVHVTSLRHALCLLYRGLAKVVDRSYELYTFEDWHDLSVSSGDESIGLINRSMRVPRVILLHFYDKTPKNTLKFSRLNVYLRDKNTCQYCGKHFPKTDLNLDHVIPVSLGGKTTWTNVVCSCISCNLKKGGRVPRDAGMKLIRKPAMPQWSFLFKLLSKSVFYDDWKPFLNVVDFSYWNVELKD